MSILGSESGNAGGGEGQQGSQNAAPTGNSQQAGGEQKTWRDSLPDDLKSDGALAQFQDVSALAKSYVHAQKMIGKKGVFVPGEKASDEDWGKFYSEIGVPPADKYDIKVAEGITPNKEMLDKYKATAQQLGLLPKQAEKLFEWMTVNEKESIKKGLETRSQQIKEGIDSLKKEWGEGFDKEVTKARAALVEFGGPEMSAHLDKLGISSDPLLVKTFAKIGGLLKEDKLRGEGVNQVGSTPEEMKRELNDLMKDPAYYDKTHGNHQRVFGRVTDLFKKLHG